MNSQPSNQVTCPSSGAARCPYLLFFFLKVLFLLPYTSDHRIRIFTSPFPLDKAALRIKANTGVKLMHKVPPPQTQGWRFRGRGLPVGVELHHEWGSESTRHQYPTDTGGWHEGPRAAHPFTDTSQGTVPISSHDYEMQSSH